MWVRFYSQMFPIFSFIFTQASHNINTNSQINSVHSFEEYQQMSIRSHKCHINQDCLCECSTSFYINTPIEFYQGTFNTGSTDLWPSNSLGLMCQSQSLIPHTRTSIYWSGQNKPQYTRGCSVYILTDKATILHINSLPLPYKLSTSVSTFN